MNGAPYDAYDGELTYVGLVLSRLPIDIKLGRLILLGHAFGCLEETVIIGKNYYRLCSQKVIN